MSTAEADERPQEIIIVRRGGDDEEGGHHGGAWKIAFADFMTAMMCFFLVMWLINAANDQTKAAVASYFNPVKLVDRSTNSRGLEDDGEGSRDATSVEKPTDRTAGGMTGPEEDSNPAASEDDREFSDENLFSDPYAVLAEIAADTGARQNISEKGDGGSQAAGPATGASGGESYRDPFAPDFWTQQVAAPRDALQGGSDTVRADPAADNGAEAAEAEPGSEKPAPTAEDAVTLEKVAAVEPLAETTEKTEAADGPDSGLMDKRRAMAEAIREELIKAFEGASLEAHVAVGATDDGVLITITDDMKHGMFPVGSAVPHRNLVLAMERIGKTLSTRKGSIRINGHTDGRPFSSKTYDNWRLSTARAHAAYYMLVRGGLAERRVVEVAGFADRKLKVPDDPYSDRNRRIEVVLEVPQ